MKFRLEYSPGDIVYIPRRRTLGYEVAHGFVEEIRAKFGETLVRVAGFGTLPARIVFGSHDTAQRVCDELNAKIERSGKA